MENAPGLVQIQADLVKKKLNSPSFLYPFEQIVDRDSQGKGELLLPQGLIVPAGNLPVVSIIIPVYNQALYTFNCLRAIAANSDDIAYEVIVIDDCSQDQTLEMLSQIKGIKVYRNSTNQGFIFSCNRGASLAQGQYLCFLNNDTQVLPGWLGHLMGTFRAYPRAGGVGAKLLYGDRTLQEAGGMITADGRATNWGKYRDRNQPAYNYVREVDYCSAACLMVPTDLFRYLGGFDPNFAPAYYEDTDLCFQIRAQGYEVLYQPRAVVIHYEGVSHGHSVETGMKQYQVHNQFKFWRKWRDRLQCPQPWGKRSRKSTICLVALACSEHLWAIAQILKSLGYHLNCWIEQLDFGFGQRLQQQGVELLYSTHLARDFAAHLQERRDLIGRVYCLDQGVALKYKSLFQALDLNFQVIALNLEI